MAGEIRRPTEFLDQHAAEQRMTQSSIHLRRGVPNDLRALHALDQTCYRQGIAYSMPEMRRYLCDPRTATFIAEETTAERAGDRPGGERPSLQAYESWTAPADQAMHAKLAGFLMARWVRQAGGIICNVITIDVAPLFRRRGVGRLLMRAVEHEAQAERASIVRLEVAVDNPGAQEFYLRQGFVAYGLIPGYYMGTLDAIAMEKRLPPAT